MFKASESILLDPFLNLVMATTPHKLNVLIIFLRTGQAFKSEIAIVHSKNMWHNDIIIAGKVH